MGWYTGKAGCGCCGGSDGGGNVEATCPECSTYTLTISGVNDSVTNPGTDLFGNPLPLCGATNLNGTFTGTISRSLAQWGFYPSTQTGSGLFDACGARQTVYNGTDIINSGDCGCGTNFQSSNYDIAIGFDVLPNFLATYSDHVPFGNMGGTEIDNPCIDPNDVNWPADPDTNWIEVTLWYKEVVFPIFGNLPTTTYRPYRFAPSTCTPSQTECSGFTWNLTSADLIEYPARGSCNNGAIDTSNISITVTLGA